MSEPRQLDRDLLRRAGEHLGTLAEQAREAYELRLSGGFSRGGYQPDRYNKMVRLERLSREVLEVANG